MKQATLRVAGTAALGVAIAAAAAGSASAAASGGLGLPTTALTNPAALNSATGAVSHLPATSEVTGIAQPLTGAPAADQAPAAQSQGDAAPADAPAGAPAEGSHAPAAAPAPAKAPAGKPAGGTRAGLPVPTSAIPGAQGLEKTPVGGLLSTAGGLGAAGGGGTGLPIG